MKKPVKKAAKKPSVGLSSQLVLIIAVVIGAVLLFSFWKVYSNNDTAENENAEHTALDECQAENQDADLCHFINGWKDTKQYHVEINNTSDGKTTTATFQADGDKSHILSADGGTVYEVITIGQTMYTKAGDGTWWSQQIKSDENPAETYDYEFTDPNDDTAGQKPTYEQLGMEACGTMECFKYKVTDPKTPEDVTYLWFDTNEYLARRIRVESKDNSVSEQTFTYDNISISEPSPVKELGPNQYILPGQTEPVTLPSAP